MRTVQKSSNNLVCGWGYSALVFLLTGTQLGTAHAQATKTIPSIPQKFASLLDEWETGIWKFAYATEEENRECTRLYWGCYASQESYNAGIPPRWPFPLTPEAEAENREIVAALGEGRSIFDPDALCLPTGLPNSARGSIFGGFRFVAQPDRYYMIINGRDYTYTTVRTIWMDGRPMPVREPYEYTYNGDSIGRWEGDTLVIESRNITGDDTSIAPNTRKSDDFWVIERWTPVSADLINVEVTFKDEQRFTAPYTQSFVFTRDADEDLPPETRACRQGIDQRYNPDPETGELTLSGPGMAPLEIAEQ